MAAPLLATGRSVLNQRSILADATQFELSVCPSAGPIESGFGVMRNINAECVFQNVVLGDV